MRERRREEEKKKTVDEKNRKCKGGREGRRQDESFKKGFLVRKGKGHENGKITKNFEMEIE